MNYARQQCMGSRLHSHEGVDSGALVTSNTNSRSTTTVSGSFYILQSRIDYIFIYIYMQEVMLTLPMLLLSSCGITNAGGGAGSATGCGCSMESSPAYAVGDAGSEKGGPPGRGKGREIAVVGILQI